MNIVSRAKRWLVVLVLILAAGSLALGGLYARGFWDESKAVHIKADRIETSTLAIGTHLIHLSALTDSIYELAMQSADESGQNTIYYKSELGGNAWFDITSANSLTAITQSGTAVKTEEIEALYFTHHTKSDKVTYDLRTGKAVNIFNIRDPYDLENLDELSPLKMFYDQTIELEGENDITKRIDEIWKTPMTGEAVLAKEKEKAAAAKAAQALLEQLAGLLKPETEPEPEEEKEPEDTPVEKMDHQLAALQSYLDVLTEYGADARQTDKVTDVMAAVDAGRRYQVFVFVEAALNEYMDELSGSMDAETPAELLSALAESIGNVQEALITNGGKMLDSGLTVISNAEYEFANSLIRHAEEPNHAACDGDVKQMIALDNIQNNVISDRLYELELLNNTLLPTAQQIYLSVLGMGESAEYRAAVRSNASQAVLNKLIEEYDSDVNTRRGELEFLAEAKCSRLDAQSASEYVTDYTNTVTGTYTTGIPKDAFQNVGLESVGEHINFLSELQRGLNLAAGGNEMDQLTAEKQALQQKRLQALDNNDLAAAKALQEQINAVEESIRDIEAEAAAQIAQLQNRISALEPGSAERAAAEAELANLQNNLSDGSMAARVNQLKNDVLDSIPTGSFTGSGSGSGDGSGDGTGADAEEAKKNAVEGIEALNSLLNVIPELALPSMEEIRDALVLSSGAQDLVDEVNQSVDDTVRGIEARVADRIAQLQILTGALDPDSEEAVEAKKELDLLNSGRLDGSVVAGVDALKQEVLDSIEEGNNAMGAAQALGTLIGLLDPVPELALPALQEIYEALLLDGTNPDMTDTVAQVIGAFVQSIEGKVNDRIDQLEELMLTLELGSGEMTAAQTELGSLQNILASGSAADGVSELTQKVLDSIDSGFGSEGTGEGDGQGTGQGSGSGNPEDDRSDALNTLTDLLGTVPELVLPALQEIYNDLLLNGGDPDMIDSIEQAILDNPYVLKDELTAEQVRAAAKGWLLENLDGVSESAPLSGAGGLSREDDMTTLAAIIGMQMYHEQTGDKAAQQVMESLAREMANLGNPLVFEGMNDGSGEYVPLSAVQAATGRRYVWNKNASLGVLALGSDYYGFTVYSNQVLRDRDGELTEKMARSAKYQNGIYVPEEYTQQAFDVSAQSLTGTTLACICSDAILEQAQEMFTHLMEL